MKIRLRPWMLVSAVWIAPAVLAVLENVGLRSLHGEQAATAQELLWSAGDWLVYVILTPAVYWIANRWPIARPHLSRRLMLHIGIALAFCVFWATGGKILEAALALIFKPEMVRTAVAGANGHVWAKLWPNVASWILVTLPFGVIVYGTVVGMTHAIRYFDEARDREVQVARLSEQLSGARFAALQAQLNPHFLFNTLNTIAVLVRDGDRAGATLMVEQLSDILRRTLNRHRTNEVTLEEELELVRQYLAIERARFSDRLRPEFVIDERALSAAVPSFALQHLVENAIRHGISKRADAGHLRIAVRRTDDVLELSVRDDGSGATAAATELKGHGIDSTRERLRALYGDRASLTVEPGDAGGTNATLRIPYRELASESGVAER